MDKSSVHLIIYRARRKDVIDTLPLTLIAVCASDSILSLSIFCKVQDAVLADLTDSRTISTVVEIASNQNKCLGGQAMDRINRLTKTICHDFAERTAIPLSPIATGGMHDKDMKCVARDDFTTSIENITCRTHTF